MSPSAVRAAGGIVVRETSKGPKVLLVHRPKYDDWTFPKGKLLPGEKEDAAALREVEEESGLACRLGDRAGKVRYRDRNGRPKVVTYWRMTPKRGRFRRNDEVDRVRWLPVERAAQTLTYDYDRDLLREVADELAV